MIIACSVNALKRIRQACYRRAAKADGRPLIIDEKSQLASVRPRIDEIPDASALVWNFDFVESPVVSGSEAIGTVITGYLYQREAQLSIVLNSLDDGDLCRIGAVAHAAIREALSECYITPDAIEGYLEHADRLGVEVADACGLRFAYPYESPKDETMLVANSNRSAASGLTKARAYHEAFLFGEGNAPISHELVDHYACYKLNERAVEYKCADGRKRRSRPFLEMRRLATQLADVAHVPAVELKLTLIDDRYLYRKYADNMPADVPECWRNVVVPLDAPLSWVHGVIQKTFNWYDYHLHRFTFLDFDAREAFDDLFTVECGIERFGEEPLAQRQEAYDAIGGRGRFKELTGLDDKWLMRSFSAYAKQKLVHEDFPQAELPEAMPIGLALFGSAPYEAVMDIDHLEHDVEFRKMMKKYYASLRETQASRAAKDAARAAGVPDADSAAHIGDAPDAVSPVVALSPEHALSALVLNDANALYYNYDFGDDWGLSIEVVDVRSESLADMPRVVAGAGHTPPEDCGGVGGFANFIEAYELVRNAKAGKDALADAEALDEAEDLVGWAQGVVGWRAFVGPDDLAETFNRPGRM